MDRYEIIEICERDVLDTAVRLFGATKDQLSKFDDYEGCANKEYFQSWGRALGQTHRLTKTYQPPSASIRRPERFAWEYYSGFPYGEQLAAIRKKYNEFMWKV